MSATNYGSFSWPGSVSSNPSIGTTGSTAPTSATEIGGINPSGNLTGANVDASGNLIVNSGGGGSPVNTNGSLAQSSSIGNGGTTSFNPPSNAVGFIMEADNQNTDNLRWSMGSTAPTTSTGMQLEPGRDTGFVPCAKTIKVIAETTTGQAINIQWIMSS